MNSLVAAKIYIIIIEGYAPNNRESFSIQLIYHYFDLLINFVESFKVVRVDNHCS